MEEGCNIERSIERGQEDNPHETLYQGQYGQTKYRWIILVLASIMMVLNGLLNNIIIPLETKMVKIYSVDSRVVNLANILSFLGYLVVNIPANYLLDKKGIRFGIIVGNSIYLVGIVLSCFINASFSCVVLGYLIFVMGQPFILNIPAKIATYWFLPANRALATSIMVGSNVIGSGIGFAIPTLVVNEQSEDQYARRQIFSLYLGYAFATLVILIMNLMLIKAKPTIPSSKIDKKQPISIKQTFNIFKSDHNLWKFFGAYSLFYGTFLIFGASANFLIKPFGYSDIAISLAAVCLIMFGTIGAIISSIYIKKTRNYKKMITFTSITSCALLVALTLQLFLIPAAGLTMIIVALVGFHVVPIVPATYEIGCEVAFPIGQAQITGILNGGALFWAFIMDSILTAIIGFGTENKTLAFMSVLILFLVAGTFTYRKTKIVLKRKQFQESTSVEQSLDSSRVAASKQVQMVTPFQDYRSTAAQSHKPSNYDALVEETA